MKEKVIVVGGGLAGLTAANFLAKAGSEVTLFEKSHTPGGRAATTEKDGIHFNLGPHALYQSGRANQILRELNVEFSGRVPKVDGSLAIDGGRARTLPGKMLTLLATSLLNIPAKVEVARLFTIFPKIDAAAYDRLSVRQWLEQEVRHEGARRLLQAFFRVASYSNDPDRQSAGAAIKQFQLAAATGVLYLDGGWQTLIDGLRTRAEESGVKIAPESRVVKIERSQPAGTGAGRVTGVRLADRSFHAASAVVVATSPDEACELIEGGEQTMLGEWARKAIPVKAACLDVALERLPKPENNFALGIDRPLYLSVHSATARLAPAGNAVIHVAMYLGSENPADPKAVEHELEELLDLVQPGWQRSLIRRRFLPALTVTHALPTAEQGGTAGRASVEVPGIEGLFLAGDWVGKEGLLADASVASGKLAAELAARQTSRRVAVAA